MRFLYTFFGVISPIHPAYGSIVNKVTNFKDCLDEWSASGGTQARSDSSVPSGAPDVVPTKPTKKLITDLLSAVFQAAPVGTFEKALSDMGGCVVLQANLTNFAATSLRPIQAK